jgi:prevent-host-death family protein
MREIGVREFKNKATTVVRSVRENQEEYLITVDGVPAAVLRPVTPEVEEAQRQEQIEQHLRELDDLADEITAAWKSPLSAAEIVAQQRRQL